MIDVGRAAEGLSADLTATGRSIQQYGVFVSLDAVLDLDALLPGQSGARLAVTARVATFSAATGTGWTNSCRPTDGASPAAAILGNVRYAVSLDREWLAASKLTSPEPALIVARAVPTGQGRFGALGLLTY